MVIEDLESLFEYFPVVSLPVTLSVDEAIIYSRENKPLPESLVDNVFLHFEKEEVDQDIVEFIPCFRLNDFETIHALIYYRSDLILNEFHLITISPKGKLLDKKAVAGSFFRDQEVIKSVASIDEDGVINVVIGSDDGSFKYYNPQNSQVISYEIAPDGKIILATNSYHDKT